MLYGNSIEIDEETKIVTLTYPNGRRRVNLKDRLSMFYKVLSDFHANPSHTAAVYERSAELHRCEMVDVEAEEKSERLKVLEHHHDTTVGLWATDRPELFRDHPHYGLLFEIQSLPNSQDQPPR